MKSREVISSWTFAQFFNSGAIEGYEVIEPIVLTKGDVHHLTDIEIFDCKLKSLIISGLNAQRISLINCEIERIEITFNTQIIRVSVSDCKLGQILFNPAPNVASIRELSIQGTISARIIEINFIIGSLIINEAILSIDIFHFNQANHISISKTATIQPLEIINNVKEFVIVRCVDLQLRCHKNKIDLFNLVECKHCVVKLSTTKSDVIKLAATTNSSIQLIDVVSEYIDIIDSHMDYLGLSGNGKYILTARKTELSSVIDVIEFKNFILQQNAQVAFHDVETSALYFKNFENQGNIRITNTKIDKELSMILSDFRKSNLNNVSLGKSCKVTLSSSDISEITFNNFRWNNSHKLQELVDTTDGNEQFNNMIGLREAYRQLKANYIRNNNKIEALEFQKHELRVHFEILKQELRQNRSLSTFGNFLVVGSNKIFSDFGQNIWKPFALLFLVHLLLLNFLLCHTPELQYGLGWPLNWEATKKGISLYFQTILPTHTGSAKDYFNKDVYIGGFWDFLIRVFSGYFIFYFISASRKYHQ